MAEDPTRVDATAAAALAGPLARSEDDLDPLVGTMLGAFRVDAVLGRGGMGVVYRAWDTRLDRAVALKTVLFESKHALVRFRREAKAQAKLRHRNVVPVHLIDEQNGVLYLVMDLVDGGSLRDLLETDKRLTEARALEIVDGIAAALAAAQERGLVHRDVKPSNVLVERDGHVLLADFGLAREMVRVDDAPASMAIPRSMRTMGAVGTPAYLAPEQLRGEEVDHRADIYALGVTLYELLTGVRPPPAVADRAAYVASPPPSSHVPGLSAATDALCTKMLAFDPDERFATYGALRAAIAAAREVHTPRAPIALRLLAFPIDALIFLFAAGLTAKYLTSSERAHGIAGLLLITLFAGALEAAFGTTFGKRLFGLMVVAADAGRVVWWRSLVRNLVKWLPLYAGLIFHVTTDKHAGPLMFGLVFVDALPLLSRHRATLHDLVAKTRVVRRARSAS